MDATPLMTTGCSDGPLTGAVHVMVAGCDVACLPERALWIATLGTLVVADLHWGKGATFRAAHVPVPLGTTAADLERLTRAVRRTRASRLVILGDLLHAETGWHATTAETVSRWRAMHADLEITLVRGNHDRHAGDPPVSLGIHCLDGPLEMGPFTGVHEPVTTALPTYVLGGHLHPCAVLRGRGRQALRLPAFVFGSSRGIVPAFSSFTGTGMYQYETGDRLFAIAGDEVVAVG